MKSKGDNCSGPPDYAVSADPMAKTPSNMTNLELWEMIAARTDLIGGDCESREDGDVYRGPLKRIFIEESQVTFEMSWSATRPDDSDQWIVHHVHTFFTDIEGTRSTIDSNGKVDFFMKFLGPVVIFPKGQNNLDPATVKGLKLK